MESREVAQIAEQVFSAQKYRIRTHVIAQVTAYDAATNTATVQPVTKAVRLTDPNNPTTVELPEISEVPVHQGGSGKLWCTLAPAVDTYGLLHISDRIIDDWLAAGGIVDPTGIRCHDLSDAVFYPSLLHLVDEGDNGKLAVPVETDRISLRTRTGKTEISVLDDETVEIRANDSATVTIATDGSVSVTADGDISIAKSTGESDTVGSASVDAGNGTDFVALSTLLNLYCDTLVNAVAPLGIPVVTPSPGATCPVATAIYAAHTAATSGTPPAVLPSAFESSNLKAD